MTMPIEQFTGDRRVVSAIDRLRRDIAHKEFSDVLDECGAQYIDLVLQGGGVLGVALVGYTYALEQAGLRFRSIAGTSAGAINAVLIAALGPPAEAKSERLLGYLAQMEIDQFLDGDRPSVALSRALVERASKIRLAWLACRAFFPALKRDHGLHPGVRFEEWIRGVLRIEGIEDSADLERRMSVEPPGLHARPGRDLLEDVYPDRMASLFPGRLAIITVDAATKTKFVLPKMAELIFEHPEAVNPAWYVRASMSIPGFFHPIRLDRLGHRNQEPLHRVTLDPSLADKWEKHAGFVPAGDFSQHVFVDGGVISNFPIAEFHAHDRAPLMPTFGAKLGPVRHGDLISTLGALGTSTFNSARQALDFDFLYRNPDYKQLIAVIDTSPHNWLDFSLTSDAKVHLFFKGIEAAAKFLGNFDWDKYKRLREHLAQGPPS